MVAALLRMHSRPDYSNYSFSLSRYSFLPEYLLDADKVAAKRRAHELGIKKAKVQELPDDVIILCIINLLSRQVINLI